MTADMQQQAATAESTARQTFERYQWLPLRVQVQADGPSPWFVADEVCKALDVTTAQLKRLPAHCIQKIPAHGRMVWAVNAEGLLWLLAVAEGNTREERRYTVVMDHMDSQGNSAYSNDMTSVLIRGARAAMMAVMEVYPQKDRRRKPKGDQEGRG